MKPVILCGGGGHARVLLEALRASSRTVLGVCSPEPGSLLDEVPWLGDDDWLRQHGPAGVELVNGVGSVGDLRLRVAIFDRFKSVGFSFASVMHPSAIVASGVTLGEGVQLMAGVIVQPGSVLGDNVVLNTRVSIDHDCALGAHVHLAPGVVFSGHVTVGARTHVGPGAVAIQGVTIGADCLIGAGALVLKPLPDGVTAYGVPARRVS